VRIVSSPGWRYSRAEILAAFPPVEQIKAKTNGAAPHNDPGRDAGEDQRIRDALFSIDATERHVWLTMGMAIEAHYGQAGRALWDEWSLTAKDKHNPADQDRGWDSFKGSGISIGTLFHYAKHGGWEDSTKGLYEEWCRRQAPPKDGAAETIAFPATAFADVRLNGKERNYLIKGLLPRSGIVVVWGPPKSGKSFWCMDVFLHAALAWEYRERKVQQASVVYVALEGRNGIPARVEAFKIRHEVSEAPFYLVTPDTRWKGITVQPRACGRPPSVQRIGPFVSVKKTGRLVTVEEGWRQSGVGAEIAARMMEEASNELSRRCCRSYCQHQNAGH
jgi:hypothetical protein